MPKFEITKKEDKYGFEAKPLRVYTSADFPKINAKLSCYWEEGKFNKEKFMLDCGALSEKGAVCVKNFRYEKNSSGENHGTYDMPTRLEEAYNLLEWYLPESTYYPKLDLKFEMEQLKKRATFQVRPLLDDENKSRADEPF